MIERDLGQAKGPREKLLTFWVDFAKDLRVSKSQLCAENSGVRSEF